MNIPKVRAELFVSAGSEAPPLTHAPWLDAENSRLLATDGHVAVRIAVQLNEGDVSGPVPVEAFKLIREEVKVVLKINGKKQLPDPWIRITCHHENVQIENLLTNTQHFVSREQPTEAKFPNVDAVFPETLGAPSITLGRDILATVLAGLGGDSAARIWISARDKAVAIATEMSDGTVMLMPCAPGAIDGAEVVARGRAKNHIAAVPPEDEDEKRTEIQ
jgi:hypothetical protein